MLLEFFQAKLMVRKTVRMSKIFAITKEAFTVRIATILECCGVSDLQPIYEFCRGSGAFPATREEFSQEWADAVGQKALELLQSAENEQLEEEDNG